MTFACATCRRPRADTDRRLAEFAGPVAIAALVAWLHPGLLAGEVPAIGDHPVHLARLYATLARLTAGGSPFGWWDGLDLGLPLHALYPPGATLLSALLATLPGVDPERAHACTVLLARLLVPLGLYAVARPSLGRLGATVPALLSALDRGGWYQGGWSFDVAWGVFGSSLSLGLLLLATAAAAPSVERQRWRPLLAAALTAAALVTHPLALVGLALLAVPLTLARAGPARAAVTLAPFAAGVGLAAPWLLPFVVDAPRFGATFGAAWAPLGALLSGLVTGAALRETPAGLGIAALAGLAAAATVARLRLFAVGIAGALVATILLAASDGPAAWGPSAIARALEPLQLERLAYLLKADLALAIGAGLAALLHYARARRWIVAALVAALLALPLAYGLATARLAPPRLASLDQRPETRAVRALGARIAPGTGRALFVGADKDEHAGLLLAERGLE